MLRALLYVSLTFGVNVESVRLQTGMTHIVNAHLANQAPIPVGSQPLGAGGLVQSVTDVVVSNFKVGNLTLAAGVDPLTTANMGRKFADLALNTLTFNITDATFSIKASVASNDTAAKTVTADAKASKLSVIVNAPDRVGKFGEVSGTCASEFSIGSVEGLSGGEEQEVQNALEAMMNRLFCHGGAPNANLPLAIGSTGVDGFLNGADSTANFALTYLMNPQLGLSPKNATARADALTKMVNEYVPKDVDSYKIPDQNFGIFGLKDISMENTRVGGVQIYQTMFSPKMSDGSAGTYFKAEISGVTSTCKFTITTDIGDTPASFTVTSSDSTLAWNFARDSNDFFTKPTTDCDIKFGMDLDVPAANWNYLWKLALKKIEPMMSSAIEDRLCSTIKSKSASMLNSELLVPGAKMWENVNEHVNDDVYQIDDNLFPGFKPDWWKNTTATPSLSKPAVAERLHRLSFY